MRWETNKAEGFIEVVVGAREMQTEKQIWLVWLVKKGLDWSVLGLNVRSNQCQ
jgi:hypothetical protein